MAAIELANVRHVFRVTTGILRRQRKEITALDGISLEIPEGELFGLLGPNGAGKTTTVKILTTLLIPTAGRAAVLGLDVVSAAAALRPQIGFVFGGERGLYYRLSGRDNLRYFAELYGVAPRRARARVEQVLETVGLRERADERVSGYSRGMKQRLHLARTLLHEPRVLFLDEPTVGLDPVGARELRETIQQLQAARKTILLTTHYLFEADALCERIAILNEGRIVAQGTPADLKALVSDLSVVELEAFGVGPEQLERLRALDFVDSVALQEHELRQLLRVQTKLGARAVPALLANLNSPARKMQVGRLRKSAI